MLTASTSVKIILIDVELIGISGLYKLYHSINIHCVHCASDYAITRLHLTSLDLTTSKGLTLTSNYQFILLLA